MVDDQHWMRQAIEKAVTGIEAGQTPFGCAIVHADKLLALAHNTVWRDTDPTAHAEINALREAARSVKQVHLKDCVLYTTCEPCPMCLAAIHWAHVRKVVFGASIADAMAAGFRELPIDAKIMAEMGQSELIVVAGPLREECKQLFETWKQHKKSGTY